MVINSKSLEGRVAIVTGGGTGIGQAISLELAKAGADVTVASRKIENLEKVAEEIRALGRRSLAVSTDVSKKAEVDNMVKKVMDEFGRVDILVNNAGGSARERGSLFCESTEEIWDYVFGINIKGVMNCTRAVINHMIERRSGKIINIASIDGTIGAVGRVDYAAAKGATIGFSMALAKEVAPYQINVNCVSPGPIASETGLLKKKMADKSEESVKWVQQLLDMTGLGRFGKSEDIGTLVAFLASDEANFITGQNYEVCGLVNKNFAF